MSINDKLQNMLSNKENGTLLTNQKQKELEIINEAFMSKLGDLGKDIVGLGKTIVDTTMKITSAAGKGIAHIAHELQDAKFQDDFGVNKIEDLDDKLNLMKVNSPEFFAVLKELMISCNTFKKKNPELYKKISPIFDKHLSRLGDYYNQILNNAKNPDDIKMYLAILTNMLSWADRDSESHDEISRHIRNYLDKQSKKESGLEDDDISFNKSKVKVVKRKDKEPTTKEIVQVTKKHPKNMTIEDLKNLSDNELSETIETFGKYLDAFMEIDAGSKIDEKTGLKQINMDMMDEYVKVKTLNTQAKKILEARLRKQK